MVIGITEVRKGMVLKIENYAVVKSEFINHGKGSAFIRTKLKCVIKDSSIERTFKAAEAFESVELEKRAMINQSKCIENTYQIHQPIAKIV